MSKQWFGSVNNRIMERTFQQVPFVGMGATVSYYSDREAYTVTEISKETVKYTTMVKQEDGSIKEMTRIYPKYIYAAQDDYKIVSGSMQNGSAVYEFIPTGKRGGKFIFHKASGLYRAEGQKWVEDPSITAESVKGTSIPYIGGYYTGSNRTKQDSTAIILGSKDKYYDPSF